MRALYERLLGKTKHCKVWMSFAAFEKESGFVAFFFFFFFFLIYLLLIFVFVFFVSFLTIFSYRNLSGARKLFEEANKEMRIQSEVRFPFSSPFFLFFSNFYLFFIYFFFFLLARGKSYYLEGLFGNGTRCGG